MFSFLLSFKTQKLTASLEQLDLEAPRRPGAVSSRKELAKKLEIEDLVKKAKKAEKAGGKARCVYYIYPSLSSHFCKCGASWLGAHPCTTCGDCHLHRLQSAEKMSSKGVANDLACAQLEGCFTSRHLCFFVQHCPRVN